MALTRRIAGIALLPVTAAVAIPAVAWACSAQSELQVSVNAGAALSTTTVNGVGFAPGPIQLRWNSLSGPVLATVSGPRFSTRVTIPDAAPNVYYIVAGQSGSDGPVTKGATAFEISPLTGHTAGGAWRTGTGDPSASLLTSSTGGQGDVSPLTLGVIVLSAGLVTLAAGTGVAELRRRRAVITSTGILRDRDA